MTHHTEQRLQRRLVGAAAEALPREPDKGGAVAVVRLEAARAELRPGRLRLRRGEQTHATRKTPLELRRPGAVERSRRLDRDQRLAQDPARSNQTHELVDASAQRPQ